jgi:hypothetical protein
MSDAAFALIKVIELEQSGIRDGDGSWSGSDVLGGTMRDLVGLIERLDQLDRGKWSLKSEPLTDDELPF